MSAPARLAFAKLNLLVRRQLIRNEQRDAQPPPRRPLSVPLLRYGAIESRYHRRMRRSSRITQTVFLLCCCALLTLQLSGLHLHVGLGHGASLHAEHIHGADPDGHDHSRDVDVALVELGAVWAKLVPLTSSLLPSTLLPTPGRWSVWRESAAPASGRDTARWRPPLRAPPIFS